MKRNAVLLAIVSIVIGVGAWATALPTAPIGFVSCENYWPDLVTGLKDGDILGTKASVLGITFSLGEMDACHKMTVTFNVTDEVRAALHSATLP